MENENVSESAKEEIDDDVVGFYELLFKVDRRINPHLYVKDQSNNEE